MKKFIKYFKKSKSFCIMPWINVSVQTSGFISPCCFTAKAQFRKIQDLNSMPLTEFLNSENAIAFRKEMLSGKLPTACQKCISDEKINSFNSPRLNYNAEALSVLTDDEISNVIDNIQDDGVITSNHVYFLDLRESNLCNLMCRICSPQFSSRIQAEEKTITLPKNTFRFSKREDLTKPVKQIYFSGGEPILSEEHYDLLSTLHPLTKLTYNTNFTLLRFKDRDILEYWKKFSTLRVLVSLDDIDERLAYSRFGSVFGEIVNNFEKFHNCLENSYEKIFISISVSIFNILYLDKIIYKFLELKLVKPEHIYLNFVGNHPFSVETFSEIVYAEAKSTTSRIPIPNIRSELDEYLNSILKKVDSSALSAAMDKINQKDKLRNECFSETFPEISELITKFLAKAQV